MYSYNFVRFNRVVLSPIVTACWLSLSTSLLLLSGCGASKNPNINDKNKDMNSHEWRLIASNNFWLGVGDFLHRFDYSDVGSPRRVWYYDIQPKEYAETYLTGRNVYQKNFGGGVFFNLDGYFSLESWALISGWTPDYFLNENNTWNEVGALPGGGLATVIGNTKIYDPRFGVIGQWYHVRSITNSAFEDIQPKNYDSEWALWRDVESSVAKSASARIEQYEIPEFSGHTRDWLNHYGKTTLDASGKSLEVKLYRCHLFNYMFAGNGSLEVISNDDFDGDYLSFFLKQNPILDLPEKACQVNRVNYSDEGTLKHYSFGDFESAPDGSQTHTDYTFTYSLQNGYLVVYADVVETIQGVIDVNRSKRFWAAYENKPCAIDFAKSEQYSIPKPFNFCVKY